MFTGIIEATGKISSLRPTGGDLTVEIVSDNLDMSDVNLGDSIATNGVCLTVVKKLSNGYLADVSNETLAHTEFPNYQLGQRVNLEKAMLPTTRFGGHIVSGHVDGVGTVQSVLANGRAKDIWISASDTLLKYIVKKGSITVDGVSLTVNDVTQGQFKLTIVPHTEQQTTIESLHQGSRVNLEIDILARYVEKLLDAGTSNGVSMDLLQRSGFIKR